jgi:hypothetical protein
MELLDNVRNTRILLELKRVYSAQVKVYAYIILHDLQVGKSAITFMSRNLDDIDMVFKKISDNLNSSVHTEEMRMRWFTALCCVKNSFSTMDDMLYSAEQTFEDTGYKSSAVYAEYVEMLKVAIEKAQKSMDVITNQFEEVYR